MTLKEILDDEFNGKKFTHSLESARDHIQQILKDNPASFSRDYDVPTADSVYEYVKLKHQATKDDTMQQIAVESFCLAMQMDKNDKQELIHLMECSR